MTFFPALTVLLALTALGGYINHRRDHLPPTIALTFSLLTGSAEACFQGISAINKPGHNKTRRITKRCAI
ncbi:hypothetical protein GXB81_03710 [Paraburkholderia sp. Ac-20336]|uniref:hypothetical protein n=1 Tax=Paraburkholderia sp. Ac-20336 TaxID=2703886 RepID=UPI001981306B|nr:hypothetical protein [Paraburkholderia sp. Ac-20336]MBN3802162.1 hypothetical protein [Paraburkholderia sp. Ac-20336]